MALALFNTFHKSKSLTKTLIASAIILVIGTALIVFSMPILIKPSLTIWIGNGSFDAHIASSESEREKGLSGKNTLASGNALLMVFPEETISGIWMKDMKFPIDVVWLDKNKKVVHIEKYFSANDTTTRYPSMPAQYVIELPAGTVDNNSITLNSMAFFMVETKGVL